MKCVHCGSIIPDNSTECEYCGTVYQIVQIPETESGEPETAMESEAPELKSVAIIGGEVQENAHEKVQTPDVSDTEKGQEVPEPFRKSGYSIKKAMLLGAVVGLSMGVFFYFKSYEVTGIDFRQYLPQWAPSKMSGSGTGVSAAKKLAGNSSSSKTAEVNTADEAGLQIVYNEDGEEIPAEDSWRNAQEAAHHYEMYIEDCTWSEAFSKCSEKGGRLACIDSPDEFQTIIEQISSPDTQFYVGGRRDMDGMDYYWVDKNNTFYGEVLNSSTSWLRNYWMLGEPSFMDGDTKEHCLNLSYYDNEWVLNDVPDSVLSVVPGLSGRIGYICEFEN